MKKTILILAALLLASNGMKAQQQNYQQYMQQVLQHNLSYKAAQLELQAAQEDLVAARKFSDPVLSAGYSNNSDWDILMGQSMSVELSKSFSLGKRAARKQVAQHTLEASQATLNDFTSTPS